MKKSFIYTLLISFSLFTLSQCRSEEIKQTNLHNALDRYADSILVARHLPGLIIGVWNDKTNEAYLKGFGLSDVEKNKSMPTVQPFRIGSITKTFVVTNILQLADKGLIDINNNIGFYLPTLPNGNSITVKMLCNMTSGIENYSATNYFQDAFENNPLRIWEKQELIDLGTSQPLHFTPGTNVYYSNTNTLILASIIEKITGKTWEESITQDILIPLHLTNTYFAKKNDFPDYGVQGYDVDLASFSLTNVTTKYDVSWASAAGNMVSTAGDLRKWATALVDGTLLSPSLHQQRFHADIEPAPGMKYGLGIFNICSYWGHNGGIPGYNTTLVRDPEKKITILVMYNYFFDAFPTNNAAKDIQQLIEKNK
ncbi:MAG: beta-lactamase family protein [Bacteroidetes bacterium]|nr:beta-lactamase family protein [Bacteroidota bacterium]